MGTGRTNCNELQDSGAVPHRGWKYPGRGHVNAMLNLCRLLVVRHEGVSATVVVTEEWLGLLGGAATAASLVPRVRFETIPNVIPSEHGRAADMAGFMEAVHTRMAAPFEQLLDRIPPPAPAAIVADMFVPWAVDVAERRGVLVCSLCPISATMFAVRFISLRLPIQAVSPVDGIDDGTDPCLNDNYIPGLKSIRLSDISPGHTNEKILNRSRQAYASVRKANCVIFTSFREFEGDAIDAVRKELPCPAYAVGPCIPFMALQEPNQDGEDHMAWLDSQPVGSVLYVSLGSYLSVSATQLDETAIGLAQSKARILWAVHDAGARSLVQSLIHGLSCPVLVVPWTDQLRVLCHPSVGGFFTHCGMNSRLEALYAGVPMLTLPIMFDQSVNSRLIVEVWKIGYSLKEKARADDIISREEIAMAVERLMRRDTAEAEDMRRRANLMKDASRTTDEVSEILRCY